MAEAISYKNADGVTDQYVSLTTPLPVNATVTATNPSVGTNGSAVPGSSTFIGGSKSGNLTGLILDGSGNLLVNVAAGSTGNAAASATGAAVPASADYQGLNVGGTLRGWTGVNPSGSVFAAQFDLASVAGATVLTGHGTAAGAIRVELPTDGTGLVSAAQSGTWNINNISGIISLPTGASTAAKQPALGTAGSASADVITVQGIASMTKLLVTPDSVALPANQSVNVSQWGATNVLTGGSNGSVGVGGLAASGASVAGNPILTGARAATAYPTAVTDGQAVDAMADKAGRLVVMPNAPRDLIGTAVANATDNTSHTLIAAGAAGVFNDIVGLIITNTSAVNTSVGISDGTTTWQFAAPANDTRGVSLTVVIPATSAATAWTFQASTGVTTLYVQAIFVKNK